MRRNYKVRERNTLLQSMAIERKSLLLNSLQATSMNGAQHTIYLLSFSKQQQQQQQHSCRVWLGWATISPSTFMENRNIK